MNVNFNTNSDNTKFGELYMPLRKDIIGRTDILYANLVSMVRPRVEMLANDVDIYVKPLSSLNPGFEIIVGKVTKSPVKRFLGLVGTTVSDKLYITNLAPDYPIVDMLVDTIENAKDNFIKYREYLTKS